MHYAGTRNITILTGFLAAAATPGIRRLYQNVTATTYITILVTDDARFGHMAPVDVSGPILIANGEASVRADYLGPATYGSILGCRNFKKTGGAGPELEVIDFDPNVNWLPGPEVVAQLREGESDWGITAPDEMAGWIRDGIENPPRQRLMNRVIATGLPVDFGRRVDSGDRIYNPCGLVLGEGDHRVDARLYNDMRQWSSAARIVAAAVSPVTVVGTLRAKFNPETGGRYAFIDAVDVYAANTEDLPEGVPAWMSRRIHDRLERRAVNLEPAPPEPAG